MSKLAKQLCKLHIVQIQWQCHIARISPTDRQTFMNHLNIKKVTNCHNYSGFSILPIFAQRVSKNNLACNRSLEVIYFDFSDLYKSLKMELYVPCIIRNSPFKFSGVIGTLNSVVIKVHLQESFLECFQSKKL